MPARKRLALGGHPNVTRGLRVAQVEKQHPLWIPQLPPTREEIAGPSMASDKYWIRIQGVEVLSFLPGAKRSGH
jgi:hypothetical protein